MADGAQRLCWFFRQYLLDDVCAPLNERDHLVTDHLVPEDSAKCLPQWRRKGAGLGEAVACLCERGGRQRSHE